MGLFVYHIAQGSGSGEDVGSFTAHPGTSTAGLLLEEANARCSPDEHIFIVYQAYYDTENSGKLVS